VSEILCTTREYVATVTLNRPAKLNAFTLAHIAQLETIIKDLSDDSDVRVIVFTGAGRAFSAGGDVGVLREGGATAGMSDEDAWKFLREGGTDDHRSPAHLPPDHGGGD
jgi:enoyl-CoA hydratase/carnithine racemase